MTASRILIGRVGRAHGLDGSFVVEDASEAPERFRPGAKLLVEGEPAEVVASKRAGGRVVARLDRPAKRGALLEVARDELPAPDPDSYYVADLLALEVEEEGGRRLGRVVDVAPGAANDVLELDSGISLPFVETCVLDVDLVNGLIRVAVGFADPE